MRTILLVRQDMNEAERPRITAVISTRGRGEAVTLPVRGILANRFPDFELIVVDQSDNDLSEIALRPYLSDRRFRYLRSHTLGASAGRNLGISRARSPLVAITDDDCEVPFDWLSEFADAFKVGDKVGVVFGNVEAAPHDASAGYILEYLRREPFLARSVRDKDKVEGTSACMAIEKKAWETVGGFDEMLGVGAPFKGSGEGDFAIRVLLAGHHIYETPRIRLINHSFLPWDRGRAAIHRYLYGNGALLAKHLKCRNWRVTELYGRLAWRWAFKTSPVHLGHRPFRVLKLTSFFRGFVAGLGNPVHRNTCRFEIRHPKDRIGPWSVDSGSRAS